MPKPRRKSTTLRGTALFIEKLKPFGRFPEFRYDQSRYTQLEKDHEPMHLELLADSNRLTWAKDDMVLKKMVQDAEKKVPLNHQNRLEAIIASAISGNKKLVVRFANEAAKRIPPEQENAERIRQALDAVAKKPGRFIQAVSDLREADPRVVYFKPTHDHVDHYYQWLAKQMHE